MKSFTYSFLFAIAVSFIFALPAQARLGETIEQCIARYGKEQGRMTDKGETIGMRFEKNNYYIDVGIKNNVVIGVAYSKINHAEWTEKEQRELSEDNKENSSWKVAWGRATRDDGKATRSCFGGILKFTKKKEYR